MEYGMGEVILFGGNFVPRGFEECDGGILPSDIDYYSDVCNNMGIRYATVPGSNADVRNTYHYPNLTADILRKTTGWGNDPLKVIVSNSGIIAMMEGYVGMIKMSCAKTLPSGWEYCNGQELSIADYPDLFAIIGTKYGGDGTNKFALPKLSTDKLSHDGNNSTKFMIATSTPSLFDSSGNIGEVIFWSGGDNIPFNGGSDSHWEFCDGQKLSIDSNTACFSILGTHFGGSGRTDFGLPNISADKINEGTASPRAIICIKGLFPSRS
jgi:microcystin-dependent protein